MIRPELKKLLRDRGGRWLLAALLAVPLLYFFLQLSLTGLGDAFKPKTYVRMYEALESADAQESADTLARELQSAIFSGQTLEYADTESFGEACALYRQVIGELEYAAGYQDTIQSVLRDCRRVENVALFQKSASAVANAVKTEKDFSALSDMAFDAAPLHGVSLLFVTDRSLFARVAACLLLVSMLVCSELEEGTVYLLRITTHGRGRLILQKFAAGLLVLSIFVAADWCVRLLLVRAYYGSWDGALPIQAVEGMSSCVLRFNISQMLLLYPLYMLFVCFAMYAFIFLLGLLLRQSWKTIAAGAVLYGVAWLFYERIEETSFLAWLKWLNPAAFLHIEDVLLKYRNLILFGRPVRYLYVASLFCALVLALLPFAAVWRFSGMQTKERQPSFRLWPLAERMAVAVTGRGRLSGAELRKWSFYQRGLILCVLVLAVMVLIRPKLSLQLYTNEEIYYRRYVQEVEGPYSQEKQDTLLAYEEEFEALRQQLFSGEVPEGLQDYYKETLQQEPGLLLAIAYGEYLQAHPGTGYVYEPGYLVLLGEGQGRFYLLVYRLMALFLTVFLCGFLFHPEHQTGMERLIRISRTGERRTDAAKQLNVLLIGLTAAVICYIPWMYAVCSKFSLRQFSMPACSIECFERLPVWLSIGGMTAAFFAAQLVYLWVVGMVMLPVSKKVRRLPALLLLMLCAGGIPIILTV